MNVVLLIGVVFLLGNYVVPHLIRKMQERSLKQKCIRNKAIILSYDDGPGARCTPQLLELLGQFNAKACFFVLGLRAMQYPEEMKSLLNAGHDVGSHSYSHSNAWKKFPGVALLDMLKGQKVVKESGGDEYLFRPPYGKWDFSLLLCVMFKRIQSIWWTFDSMDTTSGELPNIESVVSSLMSQGGGVVLLHNFDRSAEREDYAFNLTKRILQEAQQHGLKIISMKELLTLKSKPENPKE